jgi:hypothetical protein
MKSRASCRVSNHARNRFPVSLAEAGTSTFQRLRDSSKMGSMVRFFLMADWLVAVPKVPRIARIARKSTKSPKNALWKSIR